MFLLHLLGIVSVVYWASVILVELVWKSAAERRLHPSVRVGLGYLTMLVWFGAVLKFVPIGKGWLLGLALLAAYVGGHRNCELAELWRRFRDTGRSYLVCFAWFLVLVNLFLLPLHLTGTYGPFTEGGGDVSVYADAAKFLTDHDLPAYGVRDFLHDWKGFLEGAFDPIGDNAESLASYDETRGNPPIADYQSYRVAKVQRYASFQFSPTAQWSFLTGSTNYAVFYGLLAFQYACLVYAFSALFAGYGRLAQLAALLLVVSSHGLVSAFYNVYYLQATAVTLTVLGLCATASTKPSWATSLKTVGLCVAMIAGSAYLHFLSVIPPLLLLPLMAGWFSRRGDSDPGVSRGGTEYAVPAGTEGPVGDPSGAPRSPRTVLRWLARAVFVGGLALWVVGEIVWGVNSFLPIVKGMAASVLGRLGLGVRIAEVNVYFGAAEPVLSLKWLTYFFGAVSQQHYEPFVRMHPVVQAPLAWCVAAGVAALVFAWGTSARLLWLARHGALAGGERCKVLAGVATAMVCFAIVALHHTIVQQNLYTQAKGAQNVLVPLYVALLTPFALVRMVIAGGHTGRWLPSWSKGYGVVLAVFAFGLLVPRGVYAAMMGYGFGRASILETSYFESAERIVGSDPLAFVLMEPRTSADTYIGIQPFAGRRMVPTRYLALSRNRCLFENGRWVGLAADFHLLGSDLLSPEDLPHLWLLTAVPERTHRLPGGYSYKSYVWKAEQLAAIQQPRLMLFGHDYEAFLNERPRSDDSLDTGWFSYLRNGSAVVVLPPGAGRTVIDVKLQPRTATEFDSLLHAAQAQAATVTGVQRPRPDEPNGFVTVTHDVARSTQPTLVQLIRFWGEFWVNVRIDGQELRQASAERVVLSVVRELAAAGGPVTVRWDGLEAPTEDDWIGVFPVGGGDSSRLAFGFTGGGKQGTLSIPLPASAEVGRYELRMYSHGTWRMIGRSAAFAVAR
jgi:hypothetical protein